MGRHIHILGWMSVSKKHTVLPASHGHIKIPANDRTAVPRTTGRLAEQKAYDQGAREATTGLMGRAQTRNRQAPTHVWQLRIGRDVSAAEAPSPPSRGARGPCPMPGSPEWDMDAGKGGPQHLAVKPSRGCVPERRAGSPSSLRPSTGSNIWGELK